MSHAFLTKWARGPVLVLGFALSSQAAWAQTIDHSAGFGSNSDLTRNPCAAFAPAGTTVARFASATNDPSGSFWHTSKVDVRFFTNTFQFQFSGGPNNTVDGITFTIQNAGVTKKGSSGAGLGYKGIGANSVGVAFSTHGVGSNKPGYSDLVEQSLAPSNSTPVSPVDFSLGHVYQADMTYDGTTLDVTITDTVTKVTHVQSYSVNIPAIVGGSLAYAGFTGGTVGTSSNLDILSWLFTTVTPPPAPTGVSGTPLAYPQGLYGDVLVQWKASTGATYYTVYQGTSATGPWTKVGNSTTTTLADTLSSQGQTYTFMVTASNLAGTSPDSAASAPVTTLVAPPQSPKRSKTCGCASISSPPRGMWIWALALTAMALGAFARRHGS